MASETDVRAVIRALSIFDAFDAEHVNLTLQEICERIGMPKATTFRLVNTVCNAGYLIRTGDHRYGLSPKVARLGTFVRSNLGIRDIALPIMRSVNERSRETVTLNVVAGNHRLCIEVVDTPAPLMTIVKAGDHVPLVQGATGRMLLASMTPAQRDNVLDSLNYPAADRDILIREVTRFNSQGYSLTRGQRIPGVTAIAVPLHDPSRTDGYCLAMTGPSIRVDPRESEYIELMVEAGRDIDRLLGGAVENAKAGTKAATKRKSKPTSQKPRKAAIA